MRITLKTLIATTLLVASSSALAVPVLYYGEDPGSTGSVVPAGGAAETARNSFLASLTNVGNEDFSGFAEGTPTPLTLSFPGSSGSLSAGLSSTGGTVVVTNTNPVGQFSTSSPNHLDAGFGSTLNIDFSTTPISAFGFYGTDISDSGGDLVVDLTDVNDVVSSFTIIEDGDGSNNNVLFWGFIDSAVGYKMVSIQNTSSSDRFGFDDMVIGDRGQITSVPIGSTLVLFGLGLAGLGFGRRTAS